MKNIVLAMLLATTTPVVADESSFSFPLVAPLKWKTLRIESAVGCRSLRQTIDWLNSTTEVRISASRSLLPPNCVRLHNDGASMAVSIELIGTSVSDTIIYRVVPALEAPFFGSFFVFDVLTEAH
jgi:hypothetical protein